MFFIVGSLVLNTDKDEMQRRVREMVYTSMLSARIISPGAPAPPEEAL